MPSRASNRRDFTQIAKSIVDAATGAGPKPTPGTPPENDTRNPHAIALYFMHYNYCKVHSTLRVTPAMEAGLADHVWELDDRIPSGRPFRLLYLRSMC